MIRFSKQLIIISLSILFIGIFQGCNEHSNDASLLNMETHPTPLLPPSSDTCYYNNTGTWHNLVCESQLSSLALLSDSLFLHFYELDNWDYTNSFVYSFNYINSLPEFNGIFIDTLGMFNFYNSIQTLASDTTQQISNLLNYASDYLQDLNAPDFYYDSLNEIVQLMQSPNPTITINNYMWMIQNSFIYTKPQKDYVRIVASVAISTGALWDEYSSEWHYDETPNWIWIAAADAIGAGLSVANDALNDDLEWGSSTGKAAVGAAGASLLTYVGIKAGAAYAARALK